MTDDKLIVSWQERKEEYDNISGNEKLLGDTWDLGEDLVFFFVMYMATL